MELPGAVPRKAKLEPKINSHVNNNQIELNPIQEQILQHLIDGKNIAEICDEMKRRRNIISSQIAVIKKKHGARTMIELGFNLGKQSQKNNHPVNQS